MVHKFSVNLRTSGLFVAVLSITSCGSSPSSTSNAPTNPLAGNQIAASGPVLGAWWDSSVGGLRIAYGVAGAVHEGLPAYNDGAFAGAVVCMRKGIALLQTSAGALSLGSLPGGVPAPITKSGPSNARIAFSPTCVSAVEYAPGASNAYLLQGLPSSPTVQSVTLPSGTNPAAVADTGSLLISRTQPDGAVEIQLLIAGNSSPQSFTTLTRFGGAAFLPGTNTALLADAVTNSLTEAVAKASGTITLTQIAGTADGISKPLAVFASADGRFAAVANGSDSSVLRIDLTGQNHAAKVVCHCSPTELEPLAGNLVFRLNEAGSGTLWAFDGDSSNERMFFIPADQVASAVSGARR
jgi:hypothetical protein